MALKHWDPFAGLGLMEGGFALTRPGPRAVRSLPIDVVRSEGEIMILASVPGVAPDDLEVTVDSGVLTISGAAETENPEHREETVRYLLKERSDGRFSRSVRLPDTVDADRAETRYERGVVTVVLPTRESSRRRRLEVKVAS